MNLYSPKDKLLLKNCIIIKIKQIKLEEQKPNADLAAIKDSISYYTKLYEILKVDDTETLITTINHSIDKGILVDFNKSVLTDSAKDIAKEHVDLTKTLMKENGVYSEEKFKQLKQAFYKGNENLITEKTPYEYEEEPDESHSFNHSTEGMQDSLEHLNSLLKQHNPRTMSAAQFRNFATQFKVFTYTLGKQKFQQYFDTQGETIQDMQISYDTAQNQKLVYKTDFTLLNSDSQEKHLTLEESASNSGFTSTYYQNLCYTYLEANKCSNIDENLLDTKIISDKMATFRDSYKKLEEMATKCKITLFNHSIICSSESEFKPIKEPPEFDLEACNSTPDIVDDAEII